MNRTSMVRVAFVLVGLALAAAPAQAQRISDCASREPPSLGISVGRSLPYVELRSGAVETEGPGAVSVESGGQVAGRVELPVTGPLRLRVEGAAARWDVRQQRYDPAHDFRVVADASIDRMAARHLVALAGIRTGRAPACAYVGVGGGFHTIGFRETSIRAAGAALSAGVEIPAGAHGAVHLDATLHLIGTRTRDPIALSAVPTLSLLAGWAYRF